MGNGANFGLHGCLTLTTSFVAFDVVISSESHNDNDNLIRGLLHREIDRKAKTPAGNSAWVETLQATAVFAEPHKKYLS